MSCPPSALIEDEIEETASDFAAEGTKAHDLSEKIIAARLAGVYDQLDLSEYDPDMVDYCNVYVDTVIEKCHEALAHTPDTVVKIEAKLDFSEWVPEGFGTGDAVIISDEWIEVIDLKYGKGVPVSAINNPQMRLYGLGAIHELYDLYGFDKVRMTIVQPRLDSISTEEMTVEELLEWGETQVKPKAAMAFAGEGEFCSGDHCQFCKIKATCRARAEANLEMAKYEFKHPNILTPEEIGEILHRSGDLQKWAADVEKYALEQAERHGVKFPGWKLVEGRSNRKYTDEATILSILRGEKFDDDVIAPRSILGITAMEKAIGKKVFADLLEGFIVKPNGKPTLVDEQDPRPEINSTASAVADFS